MERWYTPFHFLFGGMILERYKRKLEQQRIVDIQEDSITQEDNWLLELVGLV